MATTALIENPTGIAFRDQLEADLATGVRGGNKFRLIARIWWHLHGHNDLEAYEAFRTAQARRTFAQLHADFDYTLPPQWQAKHPHQVAPAAAPAPTAKAAKLARTFHRTADLSDQQRDWIEAQGGVLALDHQRVLLTAGRLAGRSFPLLDSSWHGTAQAIAKILAGTAVLQG